MEHVREGLDRPSSVGDLAAMTGMSRSRFSRRFTELVGVPPHRWVMQVRIRQAQRLLAKGAGLSQVAPDAGFADQAHFSQSGRAAWRERVCPTVEFSEAAATLTKKIHPNQQ